MTIQLITLIQLSCLTEKVDTLVRRIYDWTNNNMDDCREDDSEANELMLKRVPYHALNYSAPFIDMRHWDSMQQEGKYWKK